ncbi:MAG: hypothetical protein IKX40_09035 [Thermoguttaceae bacterium]|nr:hypothetical protein [Selenomonadaceae bacterium]MBR5710889.1 hypothetical protein [Thermoguttaceae bacterium]
MNDIRNVLEFLVSREFVVTEHAENAYSIPKEQLWITPFEETFKLLDACGFVKYKDLFSDECYCYGITTDGKKFLEILRQMYPEFDPKFNV